MGTARFNTLQNAAGSKTVAVDTVIDGSAKAWVNFNGTGTVAIRASFNVSSITDNGTGNYTVNFATAMPDANYAAVVGSPSGTNGTWVTYMVTDSQTAGGVVVRDAPSAGGGGGSVDHAIVNVAIFR